MAVVYERSWTWLYFADKPDEHLRQRLSDAGAGFTSKRMAWYFKRVVSRRELEQLGILDKGDRNDYDEEDDDERFDDSGPPFQIHTRSSVL